MTPALARHGAPLDDALAGAVAGLLARAFAGREQAWDAGALAGLVAAGAVLVTTDRTPPEGCALVRAVAGDAELLTVAVAPEVRGRGLGARLLAEAEAAARAAGAGRLFLEVAEGNAPARALYARAGYAQIGRRREYYRGPDGAREDALVLARDLDGGAA
jgi:ribosomal-protein-alanine N-acetyltransferase